MDIQPKYAYLLVNFFTIIIPFIFSFHPKLMFSKNIKFFAWANLITSVIFIIWDAWFTYIGIWWFNDKYLIGHRFLGLPLEEILFFLCIPYACLYSYHCFGLWRQDKLRNYSTKWISIILIVFGLLMLTLHFDKTYTMVNFLLFVLFIVYIEFVNVQKWRGQFYFTYLIMLLPFLIVNGVLTGSFIDEAIVNYNPDEFVGFRIFTIPFEDAFYGATLVGFNIYLYEKFLEKREKGVSF